MQGMQIMQETATYRAKNTIVADETHVEAMKTIKPAEIKPSIKHNQNKKQIQTHNLNNL